MNHMNHEQRKRGVQNDGLKKGVKERIKERTLSTIMNNDNRILRFSGGRQNMFWADTVTVVAYAFM